MMDKIRIKILEPDEFYLVDHFFDDEGVPRLDPNFSKVIAALDIETGKAVGVMCLQMVLHAEPIIIEPAYRGMGLWEPMARWLTVTCKPVAWLDSMPNPFTNPQSICAGRWDLMRCLTAFSQRLM